MKALGHGNFCTSIPVAPLGARNWYIFNFTVKTFTVKSLILSGLDCVRMRYLPCWASAQNRHLPFLAQSIRGNDFNHLIKGNTAQWVLRASTDLLPQSRSMKNGKYIQYSRIFHTFAWNKISRRISLPHYAVLPKN